MEITLLHVKNPFPVTVMHLHGELEGPDAAHLLELATQEYQQGARDLILDLEFLTRLSSVGLAALRAVAYLFDGENSAEANPDSLNGHHERVKLLNVPASVQQALEDVGESARFDSYTDLGQALSSFI
jgi:hypothetical protein